MHRKPKFSPAFRRAAAAMCVLAYLAGATDTLPQALALGAWLEGTHSVGVTVNPDHVTVVLSHERGAPGQTGCAPQCQSPPHRHGVAAHVFCWFAGHPVGKADHVAGFISGSICERPLGQTKVQADNSTPPAAALMLVFQMPTDRAFAAPVSAVALPDRPPDGLLLLRSTVLVI
jgi:hypothetical protein